VPRTVEVELKQDLVSSCVVGDVVTVLGLVKVLATGEQGGSGIWLTRRAMSGFAGLEGSVSTLKLQVACKHKLLTPHHPTPTRTPI